MLQHCEPTYEQCRRPAGRLIVRRTLEQPTREEALAFVRSVTHASGQNYTVGGPDGVTSLECSAASRCRIQPSSRQGLSHESPCL